MPQPTGLSFLGVAHESSRGTPAASTFYIPIKNPDLHDATIFLPDKGLRGSMAEEYGQIQGVVHSEYGWDGDVFVDAIGWPLRAVLGDYAVSGAGPYTHVFSLLNSIASNGQPDPLTLVDYPGLSGGGTDARRITSWQASELSFKFSAEGMFEYATKGLGLKSAAFAHPTPSFTTVPPQPAWVGVASIGGSTVTTVESGEITISRPVTPIWNVDGTRDPYRLWAGALSVKGKLTLVYESEANIDDYRESPAAPRALDFLFTNVGSPTRSVQLHMTSAQFVSPTKVMRSKDYVQQEVAFAAIANTTDVGASAGFSPIKATVVNALTTYV